MFYGNGNMFVTSSIPMMTDAMFASKHLKAVEEYLLLKKIKAVVANYAITAFPIMDICKRNNIPLIVHFHGWTAYRKSIIERHWNDYQNLFKMCAAIVCVSSDMREQLKRLGAPDEKIHQTVCGFDESIFTYCRNQTSEISFFAAGRFCDTKNPHLTILAFSQTLKKLSTAKLEIAGGDENLLNACVNLTKSLNIEHAVKFCGILSPNEMHQKMSKSTAFVQHSAVTIEGEKEGTPVTILEASATGLPVIATRHAGIQEVVIDNQTGLLSDEFDIQTMSTNMERVACDEILAQNIGRSASERVYSLFTVNHYIAKLTSIINGSISKALS